MKKGILFFVICIVFFSTVAFVQDVRNTSMRKYLVPAQITKLDWVLLNIKVSSFSQQTKWDDFGLIAGIDIYSLNEPRFIGITFIINNKQYLKLDNSTQVKVFTDVVFTVFRIIKYSLPEANLNSDIYANFVGNNKIIAEFKDGNISFDVGSEKQ